MIKKPLICETVVCQDGFSMSVQASSGHYCKPRENNAEVYTAVEVGFPSEPEPMLYSYFETWDNVDKLDPTDQVYAFVPSEIVTLVCAKHHGIVSGELPPGVVYLPAVQTGETK